MQKELSGIFSIAYHLLALSCTSSPSWSKRRSYFSFISPLPERLNGKSCCRKLAAGGSHCDGEQLPVEFRLLIPNHLLPTDSSGLSENLPRKVLKISFLTAHWHSNSCEFLKKPRSTARTRHTQTTIEPVHVRLPWILRSCLPFSSLFCIHKVDSLSKEIQCKKSL